MSRKGKLPLEQLAVALVLALVATSLVVLVPALARRLGQPTSQPALSPTAEPTAPPAAVLIPEELDRDLQGVMILVNERSFGTAFQVDTKGSFLTAASLVDGAQRLRLVDNTGGSHAVRVIGVDATAGFAEIRADGAGTPLTLGDSATVRVGDALEILASAKVVNLHAATPAVVTSAGPAAIGLRADDLPGEIGGPLVGPGGTVLGIFTKHGAALPVGATSAGLALWHSWPGTLLPLAGLPPDLVLRGSDDTSAPAAGASLASISPIRASSALTTQITLNGTGFLAGPALAVRFKPVGSPGGGFMGVAPTLVSPSAITVKVPAGESVQDYVVELTNGDGTLATSRTAFTVTP
ncbi:MAG TPA: trypsin-like peptidase domain-containing protein [Candidatus Dormibacteraeota bacterium]|nr:trypsin-like peptidase domain-containing protein [Candidatus Dormibacteraeota bacterium]